MAIDEDRLSETFAALANSTRRAILARLAEGVATVNELAEPFEMSLPAISRHLSVLEGAGLLVRTKQGRVRQCRLIKTPMRDALEWIATYGRFWEGQLDSLGRFLAESGEADRR